MSVEFAALAGHGDGVFSEIESGGPVARGRLDHRVARLRRAAGLRGDDRERPTEPPVESCENAVETVRIGVVEEEHHEPVVLRMTESVGDELRPECRAADADAEDRFKIPGDAPDRAGVNLFRKALDGLDRAGDRVAQLRCRREFRRAQPIMPDHAVLVGIRDRALFERGHRGVRPLDFRLQTRKKIVRERHATDVDREAGFGETEVIPAEPVPSGN